MVLENENASPLTSDAYFETRVHQPRQYELSAHAGLLKIRACHHTTQAPQTAIRGAVRGFSRAARKRMIEFMASIRNEGSMLFMTLTYPDILPLDDPDCWKRHFENFRDRLEHHYPEFRAIWRMELQDRKSGESEGAIAPHFHLLLFMPAIPDTALDLAAETLQVAFVQMWHAVIETYDEKHLEHGCHISPVRSVKHAMKYVSKYIAKEEQDSYEFGRRWGRIGKFDTSASVTILLTQDEYVLFKRLVRKWLKSRAKRTNKKTGEVTYNQYHKRFARQSCWKGCAIFGMGDTQNDFMLWVYAAMLEARQQ